MRASKDEIRSLETSDIAEFIVRKGLSDFPRNVISKAKKCFLDFLGVALAGYKTKAGNIITQIVMQMRGTEESTLLGSWVKVPCMSAALANGVMASALDMDDGHRLAVGHCGSVVIPAALAVAERENLPGRNFLEAIILGYETYIKVSSLVSRKSHQLHSTGAWGVFGAAAASAKLLDLGKEEVMNALGIAGACAPISNTKISKTGAMVKESIGWAAMTGIAATFLAQRGFTGPPTILGGFDDNGAKLLPSKKSLGKDYEILNVYFKPYSSCRWTHPAIDGVKELVEEYELDAEDIRRIIIRTFSEASSLNNYEPKSSVAAQFSIPYTIGAIVVDKSMGPDQIEEARLNDRKILEIAKKVEIEVDPHIDQMFPLRCASKVEIQTKDGKHFNTEILFPKGDPQNSLSNSELERKFRELTSKILSKGKLKKVIELIKNLENLGTVRELTNYITCP